MSRSTDEIPVNPKSGKRCLERYRTVSNNVSGKDSLSSAQSVISMLAPSPHNLLVDSVPAFRADRPGDVGMYKSVLPVSLPLRGLYLESRYQCLLQKFIPNYVILFTSEQNPGNGRSSLWRKGSLSIKLSKYSVHFYCIPIETLCRYTSDR
jgi:hypothetical protein